MHVWQMLRMLHHNYAGGVCEYPHVSQLSRFLVQSMCSIHVQCMCSFLYELLRPFCIYTVASFFLPSAPLINMYTEFVYRHNYTLFLYRMACIFVHIHVMLLLQEHQYSCRCVYNNMCTLTTESLVCHRMLNSTHTCTHKYCIPTAYRKKPEVTIVNTITRGKYIPLHVYTLCMCITCTVHVYIHMYIVSTLCALHVHVYIHMYLNYVYIYI